MRHLLPLALAALGACAGGSTSTGRGSVPVATTRIESGTGTPSIELTTTPSDPNAEFAIAATPQQVWGALTVAYQELKVPVTTLSTESLVLGNPNFNVRRQLGGVRLSRYLNCGDRLGEPAADALQITMALRTQVTAAAAGGSTLHTTVQASGTPLAVSGNAITCSTTGGLERRIVALVQAQVAR